MIAEPNVVVSGPGRYDVYVDGVLDSTYPEQRQAEARAGCLRPVPRAAYQDYLADDTGSYPWLVVALGEGNKHLFRTSYHLTLWGRAEETAAVLAYGVFPGLVRVIVVDRRAGNVAADFPALEA